MIEEKNFIFSKENREKNRKKILNSKKIKIEEKPEILDIFFDSNKKKNDYEKKYENFLNIISKYEKVENEETTKIYDLIQDDNRIYCNNQPL